MTIRNNERGLNGHGGSPETSMKWAKIGLRTLAMAVLLALSGTMAWAESNGQKAKTAISSNTLSYAIGLDTTAPQFEGWGVSLCWWANMCGKWSDENIDRLVDWLVSPDGLNYRIFRYNIGGGEDPLNRHCTPHHMGHGKGLRAEMEGFKDSTADSYHWERDAAQRKIMLKIKERRPDAVFEAFSNSCPWYMTVSGCVGGHENAAKDNLRPEYYEEFAHYLVDVCRHYKDAYGIEFKTLEPFNEAMSDYWGQNGSQEGCHFDKESQVKFLRILAPVLKASGLKTIVSASDETSVAQSVEALQCYRDSGVLPLVGQWNTHTYTVTDEARLQLGSLTRELGIPLWMSEVGSGGQGIAGNLALARRLVADIRLMQPQAWIDWQYVEEKSDQWCTVRGNFATQVFGRVKNYYVRRQFSAFIREGFTMLPTPCAETLAARSPEADTCVIVLLNDSTEAAIHDIDLTAWGKISTKGIRAFRTSETEDVQPVADFTLRKRHLRCTLPPLSVTTLVVTR